MSAQQFVKVLEELSEKATPGNWSADSMHMPDGYALAWLGNWYLDTDAPKVNGTRYREPEDDAKLIVFLANNRQPIIDLIRAAERHCVKRMLDDDHELRQALASFKDKP